MGRFSADASPYKRQPMNKRSRAQLEAECRMQEEEEKEKLKAVMIGICSFLEADYREIVYKITLERDPNLHYDIDLE